MRDAHQYICTEQPAFALSNGTDDEIIIARNGKPVAKLLKWEEKSAASRIGIAKGKFRAPDDFNADNSLIEALFTAEKS